MNVRRKCPKCAKEVKEALKSSCPECGGAGFVWEVPDGLDVGWQPPPRWRLAPPAVQPRLRPGRVAQVAAEQAARQETNAALAAAAQVARRQALEQAWQQNVQQEAQFQLHSLATYYHLGTAMGDATAGQSIAVDITNVTSGTWGAITRTGG